MLSCVAAGNAFVQLFLQAKHRYKLSNRKLQYLLCIGQMSRLSSGKVLFSEDIKNQKYEFTLDCIADTFVYNRNIIDGMVKNEGLDILEDSLFLPYKTRKIYEINESLSDEDKALIIKVFIRFGGYDEATLRDKLNDFVPLRNLTLFNEIPKEAITDFFVSSLDSEEYGSNEIFTFIKDIHMGEKPVTEVAPIEKPEFEPNIEKKPSVEPVSSQYLNGISSIDKTSVGKEYSILIELFNEMTLKNVSVLSVKDNSMINGTFRKITDRLYSFTFMGVPSDIKIAVNC